MSISRIEAEHLAQWGAGREILIRYGELDSFIRRTYDVRAYSCELCGVPFVFPPSAQYHLREMHPDQELQCHDCGKIFQASDMGVSDGAVASKYRCFECHPFVVTHLVGGELKTPLSTHIEVVEDFERYFTSPPQLTLGSVRELYSRYKVGFPNLLEHQLRLMCLAERDATAQNVEPTNQDLPMDYPEVIFAERQNPAPQEIVWEHEEDFDDQLLGAITQNGETRCIDPVQDMIMIDPALQENAYESEEHLEDSDLNGEYETVSETDEEFIDMICQDPSHGVCRALRGTMATGELIANGARDRREGRLCRVAAERLRQEAALQPPPANAANLLDAAERLQEAAEINTRNIQLLATAYANFLN